jgi:hypothetical protein
MFAVIAAVLFGIALLLDIVGQHYGPLLDTGTLMLAGLLCLALHFTGAASWGRGRGWRGRR